MNQGNKTWAMWTRAANSFACSASSKSLANRRTAGKCLDVISLRQSSNREGMTPQGAPFKHSPSAPRILSVEVSHCKQCHVSAACRNCALRGKDETHHEIISVQHSFRTWRRSKPKVSWYHETQESTSLPVLRRGTLLSMWLLSVHV